MVHALFEVELMAEYLNIKNNGFLQKLNVPKLSRRNLSSEKITLRKAHSSKWYIFMQMDPASHWSTKVLCDCEETIERGNVDFYLSPIPNIFL